MVMDAINVEIERLQKSLSETMRKVEARDSGIPESRRATIDERPFEMSGAKPKHFRKTTDIQEDASFELPADRSTRITSRLLSSTPCDDRAVIGDIPDDKVTQRRGKRNERESTRTVVKTDKFDGSTSWLDFKSHFEICATLNKWSIEEKGMHLAVALRGRAQGILSNLPEGEKCNYKLLCKALEERFSPTNQNELYRAQVRERRQKASETLPELGQYIRRLINLAYPTAPIGIRETLAKEQFIDALRDRDMRIKVTQARPTDLNDAVRHAVELDAFNAADQRMHDNAASVRTTHSESDTDPIAMLTKAVMDLQNEVKMLKTKSGGERSSKQRPAQKSKIICHFCGKEGHIKRKCFKYLKSVGNKIEGDKTPTPKPSDKCLKDPSKSGVAYTVGEAGMFVHAVVNNKSVKFLVDSGATLSLISQDVFAQVLEDDSSKLTQLKRPIVTADGSPLRVAGSLEVNFRLGNEHFKQMFAIAEIGVDGILGPDFLRNYRCNLDISSTSLHVRGKRFNMHLEGRIGLEEPPSRFIGSDRALVARVLVKGCKKTQVRLFNVSNQDHTVVQAVGANSFTANNDDDISLDSIHDKQESDKDLSKVRQWMVKQERPEYKAISGESMTVKSLWSQWDRLVFENAVLYRKWDDLVAKQQMKQVVVPSQERRTVLKFCHGDRKAGHLGVRKTLARIRQSYYWPGLQRDVHRYLRGCEVCTRWKAPTMSNRAPVQIVK